MSEMSFSEYSAEISALLENEDFAAAISMAQNLLRQYPKCVDGYRFLAQAVVRRGEYREAADLFRRVLSADPEDLAARVGLATVYREEGILDEAIWQMLRAFELAPGNGEVRQQLRTLFELRDGRAPGRLKLNSAALARVYMRDGWYERAVDELRVQLESESDRVDLRVALAEALWRAGRRQEAVETAEEILVELPFCLKANLFLGQFYAETGDSDAAWDRLQVAQALDPENRVATELFGEASYLPPQNVTVRLPDGEAEAEAFPTGGEEDLPQWLRSLSLEEGAESDQWTEFAAGDWRDQLRAVTEEALDQWQPDWRVELRRATEQAFPLAEEQAPGAAEAGLAPGWQLDLRAATDEALLGWEAAERAAQAEAVESEPVAPVEAPGLAEEQPPEPAIASEAPDWREELAGDTLAALEEAERPPAETVDWRASLAAATGAELEREIVPEEGEPTSEEAQPALEAGEAFPGPGVDFETLPEGEEPAPPAAPEPAVSETADWRASLAAETRALLEAAEQPVREAESAGWRDALADATRAVIDSAEHLAEEAKSTDWRDVLVDVTRKALDRVLPSAPEAEVREAPAPDEGLAPAPTVPQEIETEPVAVEPEREAPSFEPGGEEVAAEAESVPAEPGLADEERVGIEHEALGGIEPVAVEPAVRETGDSEAPPVEPVSFEEAPTPAEPVVQEREPAPAIEEIVPAELAEPEMEPPVAGVAPGEEQVPIAEPDRIVPAELAEPLAEPEVAERPTEPDMAAEEAQPPPSAVAAAPVQLEPPEPGWAELPAAVHVPAPEPAAVERPEVGEPAVTLADEVEAEAAPEPAGPPPSADLVKPLEREAPSVEDRLLVADQLRRAGEADAALTHYQAVADSTDVLDETLIERLLAWTKEDDAGARVHQLLGDIYRRRNQLREAVDQYRAAIGKM